MALITLPTEDPSLHQPSDVKMTDLKEIHLNGASTAHHGFDFGNLPSTPRKPVPEQGPTPSSSQSADSPPRAMTSNGPVGPVAGAIADFFNPEVFQIVLHNPATAHQLLKFSQARMSGENMEFLDKVRLPTTLIIGPVADDGHHPNRSIATTPFWTN